MNKAFLGCATNYHAYQEMIQSFLRLCYKLSCLSRDGTKPKAYRVWCQAHHTALCGKKEHGACKSKSFTWVMHENLRRSKKAYHDKRGCYPHCSQLLPRKHVPMQSPPDPLSAENAAQAQAERQDRRLKLSTAVPQTFHSLNYEQEIIITDLH